MDMGNVLANKKEYIFADYFRLICAVGIVALHLDPFYDLNEYVNFFVGSVLTRLCVPFFFLLSGFFLKDKLTEWTRTKKYLGHLVKLYVVYTVLYLPVIVHEDWKDGETYKSFVLGLLGKFIFVGSYGQLWYFLALIFAVAFLYVMVSKICLSEKTMIVMTILLFLIGLFFRVYDKPIRDSVNAIKIVALYNSVFKSTRNGLFFGFPFVYWGNLIWKRNAYFDRKKIGVYFGVSFALLTLEAIFVRNVIGARQLDMLILLPLTSVLLAMLVLSKNTESDNKVMTAIWCRKMSVLVFGFHLLIFYYADKVFDKIELHPNSFEVFLIVLSLNFVLGAMIIHFSKMKYGKWIEKVFL